ncbi:thioredoxin reductase [Alkalihalobacillus xiaoxiensis]|uniref:Thioredoxin reductase n=1 Tax=Shouchella xiaoxiensis TaxID=766895 RepID=A0ABS2SUI8_9BACI|nr:NAD(P)/FAD-dependent oxidoreductase [Shouchella xiaoxiensis]MBM7839209.1 thioredoxin reductase [Shouchella xiaoxiensis]
MFDCIVVGGGPAGLNAALVLGRSKRNVMLIDENQARNAVTHESHGFITRDGVSPQQFRAAAHADLQTYPNLQIEQDRVIDIQKEESVFVVKTATTVFKSRKVILATGLKDKLPDVENIWHYYGKSLFNCPFCDGWEMKDKPLLVIVESEAALHFPKMIWNWSDNLVLATNGKWRLTGEQKAPFLKREIAIMEEAIIELEGTNGQLETVHFQDGTSVKRSGGFVETKLVQATSLAEAAGCEQTDIGGIKTDEFGRTTVAGLFACGDTALKAPPQLILAAADGSKVASRVIGDLIDEDF